MQKTVIYPLALLLLILLSMISCNSEEAIPANIVPSTDILRTNGDTVLIAGTATEATFTITSNTNWNITTTGWSDMHATPDHGQGIQTVTITTTANDAPAMRQGTMSITTGDGINKTMQILQRPGNVVLEVSTQQLEFTAVRGEQTIAVISNTSWTVSGGADWCKVDKEQGQGNGTITFIADVNDSMEPRTTQFSVTPNGSNTAVTISVTQAGIPVEFSLSTTELTAEALASTVYFSIVSNTPWSVHSSQPWATIATEDRTGEDNKTLAVMLTDNKSETQRTAEISVSTSTDKATVTIIQAAATRPSVQQPTVSFIGQTEATVTLSFTSIYPVTECGVCYSSTNRSPTTSDLHKTVSVNGTDGTQSLQLSGLTTRTTYYVRAYAISEIGIAYGSSTEFITLGTRPGTDDNVAPNL